MQPFSAICLKKTAGFSALATRPISSRPLNDRTDLPCPIARSAFRTTPEFECCGCAIAHTRLLSGPGECFSQRSTYSPGVPSLFDSHCKLHMSTLLSVFGVKPLRIGGTETFARELSLQLGERGWKSVLCFLSEPTSEVRQFLDLPNISFEVLENSTDGGREARRNLAGIMRRHRPEILHLHYVSFLN